MKKYLKPTITLEDVKLEEIILKSPGLDNGGNLDWGGGGAEEEFPF